MSDNSGVTTFKEIISEALLRGHRDKSDYELFKKLAINAYRELRLTNLTGVANHIKIGMDSLGFVHLPDDYIEFVNIGIAVNGQLFTFTRNDLIIVTTTLANGVVTQDSLQGEGIQIEEGAVWGHGAKGGKNQYYYTLDEDNRQIYVSGFPKQTVQLTYISSGIHLDSQTLINVKYKEAIISHVFYDDALYNDPKLAQIYWVNYMKQFNMIKMLSMPSVDEWADAINRSQCMGITR